MTTSLSKKLLLPRHVFFLPSEVVKDHHHSIATGATEKSLHLCCAVFIINCLLLYADHSRHPNQLDTRKPLNHRESVGYIDMAAAAKGNPPSGDSYLSMGSHRLIAANQQIPEENYVDQV